MRKRYNNEVAPEQPPEKKSLATPTSHITTDIRAGTVVTDTLGKKWKLGKPIGIGGFGMIYLASDVISQDVKPDAQYVAKVESYDSGPLFVERNCYLLTAKPEMIKEWMENNDLQHLGMPHYIASGSHKIGGSRYRFIILPRLDRDLEGILDAKKHKFNLKTVLTVGLQILDVLEYVHSKGFVHSDIKAPNILLQAPKRENLTTQNIKVVKYYGCTPLRTCKIRKLSRALRPNTNIRYMCDEEYNFEPETLNKADMEKVYLVDYGLACKYLCSNGEHKEYCTDMRKAHAGTVLFCSRDAHEGAASRRSDLESVGYNLVYWLTAALPWSNDLEDPEKVHRKKIKCFENIKDFLYYMFDGQCPSFLLEYFTYLRKLQFCETPDYDYFKTLFKNAIKEYGYKDNLRLDFDNSEGWGRKQKTKARSENMKVQAAVLKTVRSPLKSNLAIDLKKGLRKNVKNKKKLANTLRWSKIIDPEVIMKRAKSRERKLTETNDFVTAPFNPMTETTLNELNPTIAMKEVFCRLQEKSRGFSPRYKGEFGANDIEGYTPAMMEVYNRMKEHSTLEIECQVEITKLRSGPGGRSKVKKQNASKQGVSSSRTRSKAIKQSSNKIGVSVPRKTYSLRG